MLASRVHGRTPFSSSAEEGGALTWRTSSHSRAGGACVRVVNLPRVHGISDSKNPDDGALFFGSPEWDAFVTAAKAGQL